MVLQPIDSHRQLAVVTDVAPSSAVECHCDGFHFFLWSMQNKNLIAHLRGKHTGCLLWARSNMGSVAQWARRQAMGTFCEFYNDVIKWKHFPHYWPCVRGIRRSLVNSPYKDQRREAFMFSLICTWINSWVNNGEAGGLRRHLKTHPLKLAVELWDVDWVFWRKITIFSHNLIVSICLWIDQCVQH